MSKYEKKLLKLINENFAPEEEAPDVSGEQKKSFVEFASHNPTDYGIDGYLKMWQAVNGEP